MALGKRLQEARDKRGLTQEQLAKKVFGNDDSKHQARISALETRDSLTSVDLYRFADALNVRARWLQTGENPSGLEEHTAVPAADPLLMQLIDLWGQLNPDNRDKLLSQANKLHAQEHPHPSTSNPFGKKKQRLLPAKRGMVKSGGR